MKSVLLMGLLLLTSFAFASSDRELRLKSQLKVDSVEILEINRDYTEVLTGMLYMYQWFDGSHDYTVYLRLNSEYEFECVSTRNLETKLFKIVYCMGNNPDRDFDDFVLRPRDAIYF